MRRTIVMSSLDKYSPIRGCLNTATQLPPSAMSGQVSLDLRETDAYALNMSPSMRGPLPPRRCFVFPFSHESGIYYPLMLSLPVSGASPSCLPSQGPRPLGGARGLLTTQPRTDCLGALGARFGRREEALARVSESLMTRNGKLLGRISRLAVPLFSRRKKVNFACAKARGKLLRTCSDSPIHGQELLRR